jgi:hypothetical protein
MFNSEKTNARRLRRGSLGPTTEQQNIRAKNLRVTSEGDVERMRLRGLSGARDEIHLAAIVQNLKTMALRLLGPPTDRTCAS